MDSRHLDHMPSIKAVMTPFPYAVQLEDPVSVAQSVMEEHDVRHVPVVHEGRLHGVVTHRDLAGLVSRALPSGDRRWIRVRQVCVPDPYVVEDSQPLDGVLDAMVERHIGSAIVVRHGKLVGIFTPSDGCRVLRDLLRSRFPSRGGDDAA